MSSISSALRPIRKGLRYLSTAVCDRERPLRERGAAQPVEARLARQHLDDHQPDPVRRGEDRPHVGDLQRRESARCRRLLPVGLRAARSTTQHPRHAQHGSGGHQPHEIASNHGRLLLRRLLLAPVTSPGLAGSAPR